MKMASDTTNAYGVRIQSFEDGSSRVYMTPEELQRSELATLRHMVHLNQVMGVESPVMRARIAELSKC